MRIATGGFHIESCTFSPLISRQADFLILRGADGDQGIAGLSPGAVAQDIKRFPFKRLKRPIYPLDPDMKWDVPQT